MRGFCAGSSPRMAGASAPRSPSGSEGRAPTRAGSSPMSTPSPTAYPVKKLPWVEAYRRKVVSAEDAVRAVQSGDRVYIHPGAAEPEALVLALIRRAADLSGVEIV